MKKFFFYTCILSIFYFMSCAQSKEHKKSNVVITSKQNGVIYNDSIGKAVHQIIAKHAEISLADSVIDALSIGVYMNGVSFTNHYGELEKGKGNMPSNHTRYEIASVTKTFTGTLAAQAVLAGKLRLEEDIQDYLPSKYDFSNLNFEGKPITIRHLLTHTSGLPANNKGFNKLPKGLSQAEQAKIYLVNEKKQTKEAFFQYLSEIVLDTLPGTRFHYSNFGTNLMGYILERVYETPFQELVMNTVIRKANMKETKFQLTEEETKLLANGYNGNGEQMAALPLANTLWGAEGGLKSTLPDLLSYMQFQLNQENRVVQEAHRKCYEIDTDYWIGYFWWIIENMNHDTHYRHDGGALGTRNIMLLYPAANIGISIITNKATEGVFENLSSLGYGIYADLK